MSRTFESLTISEILSLAIFIEESNAQRLRTFSEMYEGYNDSVCQYFKKMEQEELLHKSILESKWKEIFKDKPLEEIPESTVRETIEAVDLFTGEHAIFDDVNVQEAIEMVKQAESDAYHFYLKAAAATDELDLKNLLSELARLEYEHLQSASEKKDL